MEEHIKTENCFGESMWNALYLQLCKDVEHRDVLDLHFSLVTKGHHTLNYLDKASQTLICAFRADMILLLRFSRCFSPKTRSNILQ